uniref:Hypothetical secreted peptide n=1 Tax=Glossina morsitans morsitans TaxID=37546 RepID=D3TSS3_GLOMM
MYMYIYIKCMCVYVCIRWALGRKTITTASRLQWAEEGRQNNNGRRRGCGNQLSLFALCLSFSACGKYILKQCLLLCE